MTASEPAWGNHRGVLHAVALVTLFLVCIAAERYIIAELQGTYYLNRARELSPDPNHYEQYVDRALRANPASGLAHFERSRLLASQKQYSRALEEAITSRQTYSSARLYKHLGNLYLKNNDTFMARESFEQATRVVPSEPDSVEALASIYFREKSFNDARGILKKALSLHPRDANLAFWLGLTERELGNAGDALAAFRLAAENSKRSSRRATFSLGDAYFNQAQILASFLAAPHEALRALQLAIDTERKPQYYYLMIQMYDRIGEKQEAQTLREKALTLFPDDQILRAWKPSQK